MVLSNPDNTPGLNNNNDSAGSASQQTRVTVDVAKKKGAISPYIYGHFAEHLGRCIYDGIWVGPDSAIPNIEGLRLDIVEALRQVRVPVLRWPGGCFADEYHWKDGVGLPGERRAMINKSWGKVVEDNSFGTHEFLRLCELVGCEPYIVGNVGSGTVQELQEWLEYMTADAPSPMAEWRRRNGRQDPWQVRFFGVGNENWGCGGNMRPHYYADEYRRYQTLARDYGSTPRQLYKIACGASDFDYNWTEVLMERAAKYMDGLSLHYYTLAGNWDVKGQALGFSEDEWFVTLKKALGIDELLGKHEEIMDRYDPEKRVGLVVDEWGTWYDGEPGVTRSALYQQNSIRDALVAAITLNIFNEHAGRVFMANLAQTVNVLQALVLTQADQLLLTPTYHVFDLYKAHQGATLLATSFDQVAAYPNQDGSEQLPQVSISASEDSAGRLNITLCNLDNVAAADIVIALPGLRDNTAVTRRTLSAGDIHAHNTFDAPNVVCPQELPGLVVTGEKLNLQLAPMSVTLLTLE